MKRIFNELEHTADLAIEIYGENLSELFRNARTAFYSILLGLDDLSVIPEGQRDYQIELKENDVETLLHSFLSELNYLFTVKSMLLHPVQNLAILPTEKEGVTLKLNAKAVFPVPQNLKEQALEIKAVTLHQFKIWQEKKHLTARVIFDV